MVQLEDVTQNVALCENNSLLSAEETQDRKPAAPHTHTRLIPFAQAPH